MGKIYTRDTYMFNEHVGEAENANRKYDLVLISSVTPGVKSKTTGKTFVLRWEEILQLAVDAGIDE